MCSNEEQTARIQKESAFNVFFTFKAKSDESSHGTSQTSGKSIGAYEEKLKQLSTVFKEGTLCFLLIFYLLEELLAKNCKYFAILIHCEYFEYHALEVGFAPIAFYLQEILLYDTSCISK